MRLHSHQLDLRFVSTVTLSFNLNLIVVEICVNSFDLPITSFHGKVEMTCMHTCSQNINSIRFAIALAVASVLPFPAGYYIQQAHY